MTVSLIITHLLLRLAPEVSADHSFRGQLPGSQYSSKCGEFSGNWICHLLVETLLGEFLIGKVFAKDHIIFDFGERFICCWRDKVTIVYSSSSRLQ